MKKTENRLEKVLRERFEKIYVLALTTRKDRQENVVRQITKCGLPAPDETNWIRWFYATPFPHNKIIADAFNASGKGQFTKPNEYDCSRNHYSMVKICHDLGFSHCLILEDDILILNDTDKLATYFENLPEDYDIVQFGGFTADPKIQQLLKDTSSSANLYWTHHKGVGIWTTSGYALSRKGMEFYLKFMDDVKFWVADGPLYMAPRNSHIINSYVSRIPLVIQEDKNVMSSDIRDDKNDTIDYNNQNFFEKGINWDDYR